MFDLHDFRIIGVFYKSLLSKGPTDPFDLNDFLNDRSSDYMGSTVLQNIVQDRIHSKYFDILFVFRNSAYCVQSTCKTEIEKKKNI